MKHLLKHEYPNLKTSDYKKALAFIDGKCSQYYFLDYMRCSNGNVDDAIQFFAFDDKLRTLIFNFLIRFEVQLKADFVNIVEKKTRSSCFWTKKKYYHPDSLHSRVRGMSSKFYLLKKKILSNIKRTRFVSIGPLNNAAMYVSSYGTFQEVFKYIHPIYKEEFIEKYTSALSVKDYHTLNAFFEGIRIVRNRCAHGNHLITKKIDNDLSKLKCKINWKTLQIVKFPLTMLEGIIIYLSQNIYCKKEFVSEIHSLIKKYNSLLQKYPKKSSLSNKTYKLCCKLKKDPI